MIKTKQQIKKAVKKTIKLIKSVLDPKSLPMADREALFLADYVKLTQKYNVAVSLATVDLDKRDPTPLPVIEA